MTTISGLKPYDGTIPSLLNATDELSYANEVENYLTWWDTANIGQLETFIIQLNALGSDINKYVEESIEYIVSARDDTSEYMNVASSYADAAKNNSDYALLYRNDALIAKEYIESFVIPDGATLSENAITDLINKNKFENFLGFNF